MLLRSAKIKSVDESTTVNMWRFKGKTKIIVNKKDGSPKKIVFIDWPLTSELVAGIAAGIRFFEKSKTKKPYLQVKRNHGYRPLKRASVIASGNRFVVESTDDGVIVHALIGDELSKLRKTKFLTREFVDGFMLYRTMEINFSVEVQYA